MSLETKFRYYAMLIQISILLSILGGAVQGFSQTTDAEVRLRERLATFWDAMVKSDYATATECIHPDHRNTFQKIPKSAVLKWKIEKLSFNADNTACEAVIHITKPFPMTDVTIDWPLYNEWVLKDGTWYFNLYWEEGKNPMMELFRAPKPPTQNAPSKESAPIAGTVSKFLVIPPTADFGKVRVGKTAEKVIRVVNISDQNVKIVSNPKSDRRLKISLDRTSLRAGETMIVSVRYAPGSPGELAENLRLETDLPDEPIITIALRAKSH